MAAIRCFPRGLVTISGENIVLLQNGDEKVQKKIIQIENVAVKESEKEDKEKTAKRKDKNVKNLDQAQAKNRILASKFSPSWKYFAVCDDQKQLHLFNSSEAEWKLISRRQIEKRCTEVTFTSDEQYVLVADKSGDVYRFSVLEVEKDGELLLGHLSMLLDLICNKTTDGMIAVWTLEGQRLHCVKCQSQRSDSEEGVDNNTSCEEIAVKCLIYHKELNMVVASFYNANVLEVYKLNKQDIKTQLSLVTTIQTDSAPWDICFDEQHHLWVLQPYEHDILQIYNCAKTESGEFLVKKLEQNDSTKCGINSILEEVNKHWKFFKDSLEVPDLSSSLRKVKIDNMSEYLERKQDRISGKKLAQPQIMEPPEKKSKNLTFLEIMLKISKVLESTFTIFTSNGLALITLLWFN
ncbi:hypothetical protein KUTeg_023737 [Tegillarca granosa]|uniref:Uncharacterized protein n=1 Tax=Tegillarca granosa TaxID=220873 RepID=A0ABQ9E330_TEGGR|nr:hypothetical protein KUTeg_023737 [Tegillarca granosa]